MWENNIRSRVQLRSWIQRKLGLGVIHVEITEDQLDDAIMEAEEYWQMWMGVTKSKLITRGNSVAIPAADIGPDVSSVVDVYFSAVGDAIGRMYAWADVEYNPFQEALGGGHSGYADIVQYLQYKEDGMRIASSDQDWNWDRSTMELTISPNTIPAGSKMMVIYLSRDMDYAFLAPHEWKMFRDFALAKAMKTLSFIRSKFSGLPSATGEFTMDGDSMWANAEAMEMIIEEKMKALQPPTGIITG